MVEYTSQIDLVFAALSDPTRRDIIDRTAHSTLTVNEIAIEYDMSIAAVSKHLKVLDEAGLVSRRRDGRHVYVSAQFESLAGATVYLQQYESSSNVTVNEQGE